MAVSVKKVIRRDCWQYIVRDAVDTHVVLNAIISVLFYFYRILNFLEPPLKIEYPV